MKLLKLSYHPNWIKYGFLTEVEIENQFVEFSNGEDTNSEHYRFGTFRKFIEGNNKFSDQQVVQYLELVQIDPDQTMAGASLAELIQSGKLNPNQYLIIKHEFKKFGNWTSKIIDRIENPIKESFNKQFCEQLEIEINKLLPLSSNQAIKHYRCGGIEHCHYSKKYVNDNRKIGTRMWIGKEGQEEYRAIIVLGKYALRRYGRGTDMSDCIPENDIDEWMQINEEERRIQIMLK